MRFAIVDIETTGSHASDHAITEVAVLVTDGDRILQQWSTLVNPGVPIPLAITRLTGIDDALVAEAPGFADVAEAFLDLVDGCVFVAHNVGFDYAFLRAALEAGGRTWSAPRLCTVRLARRLIPGQPSYSLGRLCAALDIPNHARHRAMGDAEATFALFARMWTATGGAEAIAAAVVTNRREAWLPQHVDAEAFERLPTGPGVYRFLDGKGVPLYIGMSHNVRTRVRSHFTAGPDSARRQNFLRDIHRIEADSTGSVLLARLWEDVLIRRHWPAHNRAQKQPIQRTWIVRYLDRAGYIRLAAVRRRPAEQPLRFFHHPSSAREWLYSLVQRGVHPALLGLGDDGTADWPAPAAHGSVLEAALAADSAGRLGQSVLVEPGRSTEEVGLVLLESGGFAGMGFVPQADFECDPDGALARIERLPGSTTTDAILTHAWDEHHAGVRPLHVWAAVNFRSGAA
jgi:DNA polymerase-3 subunit epsilon